MAYRPHLDRTTYSVGYSMTSWNKLGEVECQIERIAFVAVGDGRMTAHIRDAV